MPHFHIPLQSGSDRMLKSMKRRYTTSLYSDRLNKIKSFDQDACIGVDVIVGYPTESDEDFLETYNFLKSNDVSIYMFLHILKGKYRGHRITTWYLIVKGPEGLRFCMNYRTRKSLPFMKSLLGK